MDHDLFAVDPELQRALENVGELLVVVAVQRDDAALLHENASHHNVVADDEMALQQRVQVFDRDRIPGNVFQSAFSGGALLRDRALRSATLLRREDRLLRLS